MKKLLMIAILCFTSVLMAVAADQAQADQADIQRIYKLLKNAIRSNDTYEVKTILDYSKRAKLLPNLSTYALLRAVEFRANLNMIEMLLEKEGAKANTVACTICKGEDDICPLVMAVEQKNLELVNLLLEHGALPSFNNWKALDIAVENNDQDIINRLKPYYLEGPYYRDPCYPSLN